MLIGFLPVFCLWVGPTELPTRVIAECVFSTIQLHSVHTSKCSKFRCEVFSHKSPHLILTLAAADFPNFPVFNTLKVFSSGCNLDYGTRLPRLLYPRKTQIHKCTNKQIHSLSPLQSSEIQGLHFSASPRCKTIQTQIQILFIHISRLKRVGFFYFECFS